MPGTLYIVPTPVGNMADMTPRAVEVLKSVDLVLCEDTRTSAPLLRHFEIATPVASHHKFNEHTTCVGVVERIVAGQNIALISDAGTPGISDPGFMLSRQCRQQNVPVVTLPGATAFVPALVSSGLPCERFTFQGFLPPKKGRKTRIDEIAASPVASVIYESPLRLAKTLSELATACGNDRDASVSREISKRFEETRRDTLAALAEHFRTTPPKGEIVIIVAPAPEPVKQAHQNKYRTKDAANS